MINKEPFKPVRRALKKTSTLICSACLILAIIGPWIAPYGVGDVVSNTIFAPSSIEHILGTDYLGRDNLSRILTAIRYTVGLALVSAFLSSAIGAFLALIIVMSPRWVEEVSIRIVDALISIPSKMLALVILAGFSSSVELLIITAVIGYAPGAFRVAYSLALGQCELEYVKVAKIRGENALYISIKEILPNILNSVLTDLGLRFVFIVLLLSGLSFLGLGVQPPNADLGSLVRENIGGMSQGAIALIAPAFTIGIMTIAVNLVIDQISEQRNKR